MNDLLNFNCLNDVYLFIKGKLNTKHLYNYIPKKVQLKLFKEVSIKSRKYKTIIFE